MIFLVIDRVMVKTHASSFLLQMFSIGFPFTSLRNTAGIMRESLQNEGILNLKKGDGFQRGRMRRV